MKQRTLLYHFMLLVCLLVWGTGSAWATTAEFGPSNFSGQGTFGSGGNISATVNTITFACNKGYGGTEIRCYSGSTVSISSDNTITAISFTFSGSYTGELSTSYTNLSTTNWSKTLSSQARFTKIEVTFSQGYTITAVSNNDSYGTVSLNNKTITASPNNGYRVMSGDDGYSVTEGNATVTHEGHSNTLNVTPTSDCTVRVNFEAIPTHKVNITTPTGGTLTIKDGDNVIANGSDVYEGTTLTIIPEADGNHNFTKWSDGTNDYTDVFSYVMGTADVTFTATFAEVTKYNANWNLNGNITTDRYEEGEDIVFPSVVDQAGLKFIGWSTAAIDGTSSSAPATLISEATMGNADRTFYAVFAVEVTPSTLTSYDLTNNEIKNNATGKSSYDTTYDIDGWTGKYLVTSSGGTYFLQLGYNTSSAKSAYNSHLTTPSASANIKSITIATNNSTASGRTFYLCSASNKGTASSGDYGSGSTTQANGSVTINVTGNVKQFHIYPDGTAYIKSVTMICGEDATYSDYCTTFATSTSITINKACTDGEGGFYGTFYTNRAYVMNDDLEGSVVNVDTNGKLVIDAVYAGGDVVPAYTGLLIYTIGDSNFETTAFPVAFTSEAGDDYSDDNLLKGTLTADETTQGIDCKFYRLTMHNGTELGFYWGAEDGGAFKPGANKAYLAVPNDLAAKMSGFVIGASDEEETDSIDKLNNSAQSTRTNTYNLFGQNVNTAYKGVVIINGKKVVRK